MSAGHTPGPWAVGVSADNGIHCVDAKVAGGTMEICEVWGTASDKLETSESAANARLIAAAPELLAALIRLVPADFDEHPDDFADDWHQARQAVASARGETPKGEA